MRAAIVLTFCPAVRSFAAMQLGWFAAVLGAAHGQAWVGPAVVLPMLALQVRLQPPAVRAQEVLVLATAAVIGLLVDTAFLRAGVVAIGGARIAPAWLVVLWPSVAAAMAPAGSLGWLARRPILAVLVGAIAGPIAYDAGARLGAISLDRGRLFLIGVAWSGGIPLFLALRSRLVRPKGEPS